MRRSSAGRWRVRYFHLECGRDSSASAVRMPADGISEVRATHYLNYFFILYLQNGVYYFINNQTFMVEYSSASFLQFESRVKAVTVNRKKLNSEPSEKNSCLPEKILNMKLRILTVIHCQKSKHRKSKKKEYIKTNLFKMHTKYIELTQVSDQHNMVSMLPRCSHARLSACPLDRGIVASVL